MNKLFDMPEDDIPKEVNTILLSQKCKACPDTVEVEVPTALWNRYKNNTKDIVEVFDPAIWTAAQREVILNSQRQYNNMINFFMCGPCWEITFKEEVTGMDPPPPAS